METGQPDRAGVADPGRGALSAFERLSGVLERSRWQRSHAARLRVTDVIVVVGAVFLAQLVRFGPTFEPVGYPHLFVTAFSILFAIGWLIALSCFNTRSARLVGTGVEEYRRVVSASFWTFGAVAIVTLLFKADIARGYLAVALPVGTVCLVLSRWAWQSAVSRKRLSGGCRTKVVAFGERAAVEDLAAELTRNEADGYHVVGVAITNHGPAGDESIVVNGRAIPIVGGEPELVAAVRAYGADTVAIAGTEHFGVRGIRRLIWDLEPMGVDLVVSTGVMDVALSRLMMRPIAGLPLLHIEKPYYRGAKRIQKHAFDVALALGALLVAAPLLVLAALAVKLTSPGPVFGTETRIGAGGRPFSMLRFRTTLVGDGDAAAVLSPVGAVLAKFGVANLPQLFNVLRRDMSVVGPRAPRSSEVADYDPEVVRRLVMRPGMTGLWRISGRSDLDWTEAVRLDLSYVDNWSISTDVIIVIKTMRAPLRRSGSLSSPPDRTTDMAVPELADRSAGIPAAPWPRMLVGGVAVDLLDRDTAMTLMVESLNAPGVLAVASANLDHLHHFVVGDAWGAYPPASVVPRSGEMRYLTLLDGVPLVRRANALTGQNWPKLSGSDLMMPLLEALSGAGARIGFLGGDAATHESLRHVFSTRYPAITLAGLWAPDRAELSDPIAARQIAAQIRSAHVDVLLVCLGKPRQEDWIEMYGADSGAKLLLAFGAVVDFLAGRVRRAPELVTNLGAEWAWRLMLEPRRLARRYLKQGPPAYLVLTRQARIVDAVPRVQSMPAGSTVGVQSDSKAFGA